MADLIGRFEVIRELGRGAQGAVFLARDTHLDRQVAIKTLRTGGNMETLLKEARIVSKLQHANIVTLYDADMHNGAPYLVYAYVPGQTLAHLLRTEKLLTPAHAAQIISGVLDGIAHAHQKGVMHLDLKPANIMIASNGQPMVMDFGIARTVAQQVARDHKVDGTPHYMAPEIAQGKPATPSADLFSVGMMLYELVTGTPAANSNDIYKILHLNATETAESPSARNLLVDERLEAIILKAIAKKPEERYADANAMQQALKAYLDPTLEAQSVNGGDTHSTLEFLLRRMRSKSDFPALSSTISEINKVVDSESDSANKLTKSILQDFALTNKLLKLVNTVSYGQFGGKINTISKAVVILGFETVRNVAMTLILLEFLQNKSQAAQLKDDVIGSFFSGLVAARLSSGRNIKDAEEAMICSMFQNLGRLLATFYFFEESQEIGRLIELGDSEDKAAHKVLGITYNELGIGIAKSWNFPDRLVAGMQILSGDLKKPRNELDYLTLTANLANELCATAGASDPEMKTRALKQLTKRYEHAMPMTEHFLSKALDEGLNELSERGSTLNLDSSKSPLIKRIYHWSKAHTSTEKNLEENPDHLDGVTQLGMEIETHDAETGEAISIDPEAMLSAGIQDVTNTLVEDYKLNDVLQMVLETMHRGMRFNHTLILVRDAKSNQMIARFGFGKNSDTLLPKFRFPLTFTPDVFHLAVEKGADIVIENVASPNIASKIPQWHRDAVTAKSFLLLPVIVNGKAIGLFYADMEDADAMQVSPRQLSLLRTLRNQAVLAIKQQMQ